MMKIALFNFFILTSHAYAYNSSADISRRRALSHVANGAIFGVAGLTSVHPTEALEICPPKANNCVRTYWAPPAGLSKDDVVDSLRDVINAYPMEGQNDIDGGGWTISVDDLSVSGTARVEYKSSGKGAFAKLFNGGKPFVDDLNLEIDGTGVVQVKSQSRVGDSDFGVNGKRVDYLAATLKAKGWTI